MGVGEVDGEDVGDGEGCTVLIAVAEGTKDGVAGGGIAVGEVAGEMDGDGLTICARALGKGLGVGAGDGDGSSGSSGIA